MKHQLVSLLTFFSRRPLSPFLFRGLVIAMLTSLLFIVLLRFLAGIMVWVMIVMVILVIGYGKARKKTFVIIFTIILNSEWLSTTGPWSRKQTLDLNSTLRWCLVSKQVIKVKSILIYSELVNSDVMSQLCTRY